MQNLLNSDRTRNTCFVDPPTFRLAYLSGDLICVLQNASVLFTVKQKDAFKWKSKSLFVTFGLTLNFIKNSNKHGLESEQVQKFIHSKNSHFDLIFIEETLHDAYLMFGYQFNAPIVSICECFD